ncbi:hypothetical protein [Planctomicrobium sp. SH664]|uniref:hypothetical protein n=1 Tax=Planctomicrobium sp. SH664 TaxID=3448125 RepID=UPI003F5B57E3
MSAFQSPFRFAKTPLALGLTACLGITAATAEFAQAQVPLPHRYIYDRNSGYVRPGYGYFGSYPWNGWGYGSGMTANMGTGIGLGQAAQGLGQMAVDFGQYEKEDAEAQITYQQAEADYLKNIGLKRQTYEQGIADQQKREAAEYKVDRERVEAYKRDMSQRAAAHRLTEDQFDRVHGIIHWPLVLRSEIFSANRETIDQLFDARTPQNSGVGSNSNAAIEKACEDMLNTVKTDINNLNIDQFITAQHFIASLSYESRFKVKAPISK